MWYGMMGGCGPRGGGRHWAGSRWREDLREQMRDFAREHGRPGGGGGGRRGRVLDGPELRKLLLKLIADEPRHGYELIRAVEELSGGAYAPSPGVVYPALSVMSDLGLIREQAGDDARRRYAVADEGRALLDASTDEVAALVERLRGLAERRERADPAPVRRAVMNLREAVRGRVGRGDLSDERLHEVAAMLDEVAQRVERLR